MGCDIHMYVETLDDDGKWHDVPAPPRGCWACGDEVKKDCHWCGGTGKGINPSWYDGRNYALFSILAGVRNYDNIIPITEPRGIPTGSGAPYAERVKGYGTDGHDHSWLLLEELLDHDWEGVTHHSGWLSAPVYQKFKNGGDPYPCSRGVGGGTTKKVSNEEMDKVLADGGEDSTQIIGGYYTEVTWVETQSHRCQVFVNTIIPELEALGEPDKVRIVFFFDN